MTKVTLGDLSFEVVDDHYRQFWMSVQDRTWEPDTTAMLSILLNEGWQYFDVGAWIGPTVLLAAASGAETHALEPDPVAFDRLTRNIALNPGLKIHALNAAAGVREGSLTLYADAVGNSESSIFAVRERSSGIVRARQEFDAPMINLASYLEANANHARCQFIKMDIEGGEFELVPHLVPHLRMLPRFALRVSTHPFNVVKPDRDRQLLARRDAKCAVLEALHGLRWYDCRTNSVVEVSPKVMEAERAAAIDDGDELLVANFDLLGTKPPHS